MLKIIVATLLIACFSSQSYGADLFTLQIANFISNQYDDNSEIDCNSNSTQLAMNQCANAEYENIDLKLNTVYQQLKKSLTNANQKKLTNAQLAWLKFRDLNCEYAADRYQGGSIQPLIYYSCLTRLTKERIQHLESYLTP